MAMVCWRCTFRPTCLLFTSQANEYSARKHTGRGVSHVKRRLFTSFDFYYIECFYYPYFDNKSKS